jgi:hypothetical protein
MASDISSQTRRPVLKESQHLPDEPLDPTRREFTAEALLALLMGCVITVSQACDDDDNPVSPTPTDINGEISANHGHTATVLGAQISTGAAIVGMNIQGSAPHPHTIALSQAEVQTLFNRQPVTVTSTTDGTPTHNHTVTFRPM